MAAGGKGGHRQILAYLAAPVLVGVAVVIRDGLLGQGGEPESDLLLLAVTLAGFLGGLGPALVATAVGLSQELYFHAGSFGSSAHRRDHVELGMFLVSGAAIGVTFEVLRRVRRREAGVRRTLAMITRCNEAVLRATTEEELYADICRVIVDAGGYRMCWVGVPEDDDRKTVRPVAHAGHEDGYLQAVGVVWAESPNGRGPAGMAIRERRIVVGRDFTSEPALAPWKEEALRRGYRSVTALPLVQEERNQAVIVMYSPDVTAFSRHELRFLKQLTRDVAFGVSAIRRRAAQARQGRDLEAMGEALKVSEARLRTYFEASPLALFVGDSRGRFVDCNPAGLDMLGIDAATLGSMSIGDLVEAERREAARQAYGAFVSTGKLDLEVRLVRPDGREVWAALRGVRIGDDRFMASFQDVTERRRAVDQLRESERWLRLSQDIARIGHYVLDVPGNHWTSSATLDAIFGGKPLTDIDETIPYPESHPTSYCWSKHRSELLVSKAGSRGLRTCILRPADVWGELDPYHIGSLIKMAKGGFYVRLGDGTTKSQHVYVGNMAWAHLLAAKALWEEKPGVAGSIYFITDSPPSNFFTFFEPVIEAAGYRVWPKNFWIPRDVAYALGFLSEMMAKAVSPFKKYTPKMSRFAVTYTCGDFTFRTGKAGRELGFIPKYSPEEAFARTVSAYK